MSFAPIKLEVEEVTLEEAQRITDELDRKLIDDLRKKHLAKEKWHNEKSPFTVEPLNRKAIAFGLRGSVNYGLNHAQSDRDIFIVTDGDYRKIQQDTIFGDDVLLMSLNTFQIEMQKGHYQLIDNISSPMFNVIPEYQPLFNAFRHSDYKYIDSAFKMSKDFVTGAIGRKGDHPRRAKKYLQTALVASFMVGKVQKYGTANYNPALDDKEREEFFQGLEKLWEFVLGGYGVTEILAKMKEFSGVEMIDYPVTRKSS